VEAEGRVRPSVFIPMPGSAIKAGQSYFLPRTFPGWAGWPRTLVQRPIAVSI